MDILGIGPLELFFIILIALIVLGPNDMVKAGRSIGRFLRNLVTSPNWRTMQQASREIRTLPNRLMREAGLEDIQSEFKDFNKIPKEIGLNHIEKEFNKIGGDIADWVTPPKDTTSPPETGSTVDPAQKSSQGEDVNQSQSSSMN